MHSFDYDKGEHIKEVYAYFGRAYYMANVFETGLGNAIVQLDFLAEIVETLKREGRRSFDQARYEKDFDAFMERQNAQTFGNLWKRVEKLIVPDAALRDLIAEAKTKRDFLAHRYFRERADQFMTRQGRDGMIAELDSAAETFSKADKALDKFLEPRRAAIGLSADRIEAHFARYMQSFADDE